MAHVSVVVPAYNAARYIREALDSALAQTQPALEIIVVDDGSTDATAAIVKSYGDRVDYIYQPNARQAAARNHGCRRARGDVLAFLDADDTWRKDKLECQLALLERCRDVGLVYCSMRELAEDGSPGGLRHATARGRCFREILLGQEGGAIAGSTPVVRRSVYEAIGGFGEDLSPCEDTDFFWRAATVASLDFVDEPLVSYRVHGANAHLDVDRSTRAWRLLYSHAFSHPQVRALGPSFRARCRGRLNYMLSGDHARAGRPREALGFGLIAIFSWPPLAARILARLVVAVVRRNGARDQH